jgi:hypothetical protein
LTPSHRRGRRHESPTSSRPASSRRIDNMAAKRRFIRASVITYLLARTSRCRPSSGYRAPPLCVFATAGDPTSSVGARDRERWLTLPLSTICRAPRRVSFPAPRLGRGGMAARDWHDFLHGRFSWPPSLRGEQASRDGARRMRGGCGGALAATSSR